MGRNWLPKAGASLHFLFPPSILHNGSILPVLRAVNKSVSVIMIIMMISLKEFYQLNCLKTTILLHFLSLFFVGYSCLLRWPVYLLSRHLFSFPWISCIISSSRFFCPMLQFSQFKIRLWEWMSDTTEQLHFQFSLSCIGEGNGNPLQCSCLENPRDGGSWWAAVSGVAQSRTRLERLSSSSSSSNICVLTAGLHCCTAETSTTL